jgi:GT2 family glycosyltransferase
VLSQSNLWKEEYETADQVLPVITPDDLLHSTGQLSKVVLPSNIPPNVLQQFGRTDVAPWILLITRCVSIRHKDLTRIGGFNDRFINHGLEDWDLGYRLHRLKIPFHSIKQVVGYHQEHPAYTRGVSSNIENLKVMYELYGFRDPELNLFALIPAWEDVEAYKHTIRVLRKGLRFKSSRSTALLLKRTLRISAKFFFQPTNLEKHQNSLGIIGRKLKFKKSSRPATIVLRRILDKSSEFISNVQSDSH